jgi:hypothetical protein
MRRQDQHLVSFYLKQKFLDKRANGGGRLIAISWRSIRQQATGCRTRSQKNEVQAKSKEAMQACNHLPKINQFVHRRKRYEMQELVI